MADVRDARADVAVFAEKVLKRPLWPHQAEAAQSRAFITTVAAARRSGKSTLAETLAVFTAFREPNVKCLVLSATQEASRRMTESIAETLNRDSLTRGSVVDDFATRIRLTNGSQVISLPASAKQVRGYGRNVKLVIVDEAGFCPEELWTAAHYTALDERRNGARILLCGTPWGSADMFFRRSFDAGKSGDPDFASFQWTYKANPLLDAAYLERQRDRVAPSEFAAEVLGEWSDAAGALFPVEVLERATADVEVPPLGALAGPALALCGLDWGVSFDVSAAAVLYRSPVAGLNPGRDVRPVFVAFVYAWPAKTPILDVAREVAAARAPWCYLASEVNGVGAAPSQELAQLVRGRARVHPVATTAATKTASYGALLGLLESGQLVLPRHPQLLRQLAGIRFEQGERGFTRIGAENPVVHDDLADALALSLVPYRRANRLVCLAPRLAKKYPAEATLRPLDAETVTTGGGLRVFRPPVVQSVNGTVVTVPPGVRERTLEDERLRKMRVARQRALAGAGLE